MAKKQSLKDIQDVYTEKLIRIKESANEENVLLRERLSIAKEKIIKLEKELASK